MVRVLLSVHDGTVKKSPNEDVPVDLLLIFPMQERTRRRVGHIEQNIHGFCCILAKGNWKRTTNFDDLNHSLD